jgi:hypothetical protein
MLVMANVALPLLVRATVCGALGVPTRWSEKLRLGGVRVTAGAMPVPVRVAVCGLLGALELMVSVPVRVPGAVAWKVMLRVQHVPGARLEGQPLVCAKSPVTLIPAMVKGTSPMLHRVIDCGALVVHTG